MKLIVLIVALVLSVNTILAIFTVFKEKREISATWAWLLVLNLLPGIGFIIYLFLGRKISKQQIYDVKTSRLINVDREVEWQKEEMKDNPQFFQKDIDHSQTLELMRLLLNKGNALVTSGNQLEIFNDGKEKFERLLQDIEEAEDHIHVMYYIFRDDELGSRIIRSLEKKAAEGVKVCLMFDSLGSRGTRKASFRRLKEHGGRVLHSFSNKFSIINTNINFRNHRKMVIIDSKVGYMGGFNVGDDYLGLYEHMGYWRDTHLRMEGDVVLSLQARFIMDWNASTHDDTLMIEPRKEYFIKHGSSGESTVQLVSSGPDSELQVNKKAFMKMISQATRSIKIQTPYFIPDEAFMETLKIALASGVEISLMIPNKPDHPFIYQATLYYARELAELGANIYIYDRGFMHSKFMVIDDVIATVGTSNFDIRSFKLNFEINAYIYDEEIAKELSRDFEADIDNSYLLTEERIQQFSNWQLFKQAFSRLLSPLL